MTWRYNGVGHDIISKDLHDDISQEEEVLDSSVWKQKVYITMSNDLAVFRDIEGISWYHGARQYKLSMVFGNQMFEFYNWLKLMV